MGKADLGYKMQGSEVNFPLAYIPVADCPTTTLLPSLSWAPNHELKLSVVLHVQANELQAHTHSLDARCSRGLSQEEETLEPAELKECLRTSQARC